MTPESILEQSLRSANMRWLLAHADYKGGECLIWPFFRDRWGYGHVSHKRRSRLASRAMCTIVNGTPPTPHHHASHLCGKGHMGCVHPLHLKWASPKENCLEKRTHGTQITTRYGARGKLSQEDIDKIRALKGIKTQVELAAMFDVSTQTISFWHTRDRPRKPFQPGTSRSAESRRRRKQTILEQ